MKIFNRMSSFALDSAANLFTAIVVALLVATPATAASDAAASTLTVDWKSLNRNLGLTRVWATRSFAQTITLGHDLFPHRSQRIQYAIDCIQGRYAVSQWLLTDAAEGRGHVVWSDRAAVLYFAKPWDGSAQDAKVTEACTLDQSADIDRLGL